MKKKLQAVFLAALWLQAAALAGCGGTERLPDGTYTAEFSTDSSMFRVNEAYEGKGLLTVEDGEMYIHISLGSKNIVNLYPGLAENAQKEGAQLLSPTMDTVTYSDGWTEEVHGFDVPVPALDTEFDLALVGKKGKWYDHKVMVSDPEPVKEEEPASGLGESGLDSEAQQDSGAAGTGQDGGNDAEAGLQENGENGVEAGTVQLLPDGIYTVEAVLAGGSGKAGLISPSRLTVSQGTAVARLQWNSPNYDYMLADGVKYLPLSVEGGSVFEIPVPAFDEPVEVTADTVAMSRPHEIEYTITFLADTVRPADDAEGITGDETGLSEMETSLSGADAGSLETDTGLACMEAVKLSYAENFTIRRMADGCTMLTTLLDGQRFLVVPEGKTAPEPLDEDIVVLQQPVEDIYLVASAVMDMFCELGSLDAVSFSGQKEDGWYIEAAREAMAQGRLRYAGKYNKPDYEQIVAGGCSLAIENRMILHAPEVAEKLREFGIPVLVEASSYESHPLGRVEWVKLFGALLGKEAEAERIFREQEEMFRLAGAETEKEPETETGTGSTVAFFYVTSNGLIQVRQPSDYIPKMIELAGGQYFLDRQGDPESKRSTMNMQAEEFYQAARDADFLIYNSSIDGGVSDLGELLDKCRFLEDFQAVRTGNVWCTTNDLYQQSLSAGYLVGDLHAMLTGAGEQGMRYLFRLE